jgi:RNA polymerase sigma-70 factor (ECF subfamily)
MPADPPEPNLEEQVDDRLDDERRVRGALELLGQLPRREQDVFVLCAWSKLSYDDAGLALDIPVGTVRSRLSRARRRLGELDPACGYEKSGTPSVEEVLE